MAWPTVSDVREKLGDAYASDPLDSVIQNFLDRRKAQVQELTGETITDPDENLIAWVLNYACADVLFRDITGKEAGNALSYTLGDMKIDKSPNVRSKTDLVRMLQQAASAALETYLLQQRQHYSYSSESSTLYTRSAP